MAQEDKFIVPQRKPAVGKSTVVSVRLPDTMLAKLEDVASKTGRSRNELVQMCIDPQFTRCFIVTPVAFLCFFQSLIVSIKVDKVQNDHL